MAILISGLKECIAIEVENHKLCNINYAMRLARLYKRCGVLIKESTKSKEIDIVDSQGSCVLYIKKAKKSQDEGMMC